MSAIRDYDLANSRCGSMVVYVCLQISTHCADSALIPWPKTCYIQDYHGI